MTTKLKLVELICDDEKMNRKEKISYLKEIKILTKTELESWIIDKLTTESPISKVMKYGYAGLIGAVFTKKIVSLLNQCKITCKESYKKHKDKMRYADCIENCNNKVAQMKKNRRM